MQFGDDEVGGYHNLPAHQGMSDADAQNYVGQARELLGNLKYYMQERGFMYQQARRELPDGTVLHAQSNRHGLADIDKIWIDTSKTAKKGENDKVIGFIVHLTILRQDDWHYSSINVYDKARFKPNDDDPSDWHYLQAETRSSLGNIPLDNVKAGMIEGTFENIDEDELEQYGHGQYVYSGDITQEMTYGIEADDIPSARALTNADFTYPNLSKAALPEMNGWSYTSFEGMWSRIWVRTPHPELGQVYLGGQMAPWIYNGGPDPASPGMKLLPFSANPLFCTGYDEAVRNNMPVDEYVEAVLAYNYLQAQVGATSEADAKNSEQYNEILANERLSLNPDVTDKTKALIGFATRNEYQHLALSGVKPELNGHRFAECSHSEQDCMIAVVPGDFEIAFVKDWWLNDTNYSREGTPILDEVIFSPVGGAVLEAGGSYYCQMQSSPESEFVGSPRMMLMTRTENAHIRKTHHDTYTLTFDGFTAKGEVLSGEYLIQPSLFNGDDISPAHTGDITITIITDNATYTAKYEVDDDKEVAIIVGKEFGHISECVMYRGITDLGAL